MLLISTILIIALIITIFYFVGKKWDYRKAIYTSDISAATPVANIQKFTTENPSRYILYVGRFSCPDCRVFSATFKRLMGKYPALDFYYYDTDEIRENKVLYHEEDSFLNDVLHVSHVPSLLLMENGEKINVLTETEITESSGADVKIMDRFFRHRNRYPEQFSKPGFQPKMA